MKVVIAPYIDVLWYPWLKIFRLIDFGADKINAEDTHELKCWCEVFGHYSRFSMHGNFSNYPYIWYSVKKTEFGIEG